MPFADSDWAAPHCSQLRMESLRRGEHADGIEYGLRSDRDGAPGGLGMELFLNTQSLWFRSCRDKAGNCNEAGTCGHLFHSNSLVRTGRRCFMIFTAS